MKAHITNLGLENFRVFKDKTDFEFAPITILTGTNSSGKSSLINAMDILKDYAHISKYNGLSTVLIPPNTRNPFSSSKYLLNRDSISDSILFESQINIGDSFNQIPFTIELEFKAKERVDLTSIRIRNENEILSISLKNGDYSCSFSYKPFLDQLIKSFLSFYSVSEQNDSVVKNPFLKTYASNEKIQSFKTKTKWIKLKNKTEYSLMNEEKSIKNKQTVEEIEEIFNKVFLSLVPNQIDSNLNIHQQFDTLIIEGYTWDRANFKFIPPTSFAPLRFQKPYIGGTDLYNTLVINPEVKKNMDDLGLTELLETGNFEIESFTDIYNEFHNFISGILFSNIKTSIQSYLRITRYQSHPIQILPSQRIVPADSYFGRILSEYIWERHTNSFINKWLSIFELGTKINIQFIEEVYGYKVGTDKYDNIADLGYGMGKLIPLLYSMAGNIQKAFDPYSELNGEGLGRMPFVLLLEEPESNLHPALQSKLADMFIDAARTFNTQFIIETHSEYLIRKLQYLTAKGEIKPEDTAIYYFYPPDSVPSGEDQVKRIDIQEDGSLTDDFGKGFFDEADNLAIDLYTLLTQNRKN